MKLVFFSAQPYDEKYFGEVAAKDFSHYDFQMKFVPETLSTETVKLAKDAEAVCCFVNDDLGKDVIQKLHKYGVKIILMRCAGFDRVHLDTASELGVVVARVPAYSPEAIAEHAIALLQTLNRRTNIAFNRVQHNNFSLDGLLGVTLHGKTAGLIGTGKIGLATAKIFKGLGMKVIACDPDESDEFKGIGEYVDLDTVFKESDVVSLHCPLTEQTKHIVNEKTLSEMKSGAYLINTSRGGLIETESLLEALKHDDIAGAGLDVYENEGQLFFRDLSNKKVSDELLEELKNQPNFLLTGHQAFFTVEALTEIAQVTLENLAAFTKGEELENAV